MDSPTPNGAELLQTPRATPPGHCPNSSPRAWLHISENPSLLVWLRWVFIALCAMEAILASSLAKMLCTASLAKDGGAVLGSVLAGLKSVGLIQPSSAALRLAALASAALGSAASASAVLGSAASASAVLGSAASAVGSLLKTLHVSYLLEPLAEILAAYPLGAKTAAAAIGGLMAVGAVPVVLGAIGFTGAGITASSLAAKMMSAAAIANGGGVASGSLVATLQSVGAAGLSLPSKIILGSTGSALGSLMV